MPLDTSYQPSTFRPARPAPPVARALLGFVVAATAALAVAALPAAAAAQPFGSFVVFSGTGSATEGNGHLEVPDSPLLNPPREMTLEGWVDLATPFGPAVTSVPAPTAGPAATSGPFSTAAPAGDASDAACRSLIGKDSARAWWLGVCGSTVRACFQGAGSCHDGGTVPAHRWTHLAVTFDGNSQSHYLNGELVAAFAVSGPPGASAAPLEIGADASSPRSPDGALTEFRLWDVARTVEQIRGTINVALTSARPGLVAAWSLGGNGDDALGVHHGTFHGTWAPAAPRAVLSCVNPGPGTLCVLPFFAVTVSWRTPDGTTGAGTLVPVASTGSGIFWFFGRDSWELMVKVIDACGFNGAIWVFSAATTNVFYRMEVVDVRSGVTKIYFNYPGPPAPAVTDIAAFASGCR
jgi:hypothetical protein